MQLALTKTSKNGCQTVCHQEFVQRKFLVTNIAPHERFGHCFENWLPVWYKVEDVPAHCECPVTILGRNP